MTSKTPTTSTNYHKVPQPEVLPNKERRDILAGFVRPDGTASAASSTDPDADLLRACAAFEAAHRAQEHDNAMPHGDEEETTRISQKWYEALAEVTAAPCPLTAAGRMALARAAHVALFDQITGCGSDEVSEVATREEALALAALDAMQRASA